METAAQRKRREARSRRADGGGNNHEPELTFPFWRPGPDQEEEEEARKESSIITGFLLNLNNRFKDPNRFFFTVSKASEVVTLFNSSRLLAMRLGLILGLV